MSLLASRRVQSRSAQPVPNLAEIIRGTSARLGAHGISGDQALRNSVLWAALDLRAGLISTFPVQQFRTMPDGTEQQVPLSGVWGGFGPGALTLGGPVARLDEWLSATQMDLDRYGNAFGFMFFASDAPASTMLPDAAPDATYPLRIDLLPAAEVTVHVERSGEVAYRWKGQEFGADRIWHERAHVVPGVAVGLDPIGHAALAMGAYSSAADFAAGWFSRGGIPSSVLQNKLHSLDGDAAETLKERTMAKLSNGEPLVLGKEYEFSMVGVPLNQTAFLDLMDASSRDVCRFVGVPPDMVSVSTAGASITYANVSQRNSQFLTLQLGPAVKRREAAMSAAIQRGNQIVLDTDGLMRLDPLQFAQMMTAKINAHAATPNEWRALDHLPPLTGDQIAEIAALPAAPAAAPVADPSTGGSTK